MISSTVLKHVMQGSCVFFCFFFFVVFFFFLFPISDAIKMYFINPLSFCSQVGSSRRVKKRNLPKRQYWSTAYRDCCKSSNSCENLSVQENTLMEINYTLSYISSRENAEMTGSYKMLLKISSQKRPQLQLQFFFSTS